MPAIYELEFVQDTSFAFKVARLVKSLEKAYADLLAKGKAARNDARKKSLLHSAYSQSVFKHIKGHRTVPLTALKTDNCSYVVDPDGIDTVLQDKWKSIYDGNHGDQATSTVK